jgi:predicted ATP-dependent endonuclease of OLD family
MKLPGHQTLRLVLCKKAILVEGPSDELIIQKAYFAKHAKTPLQDGIDVIAVGGLSFKRFLDIATILDTHVNVVTDNDGDWEKNVTEKYRDYATNSKIRICFDKNDSLVTLESQFVHANRDDLSSLAQVLKSTISNEDELRQFMKSNKTECALRIFSATHTGLKFPQYIEDAITF